MGLFGKSKSQETNSKALNDLFKIAIEFNQTTGTWTELPENISDELSLTVINARKILFEYIRQLKEAGVYSNGAVKKFAKEDYAWMSKENIQNVIELGKFL